jgi:hypothetical protein
MDYCPTCRLSSTWMIVNAHDFSTPIMTVRQRFTSSTFIAELFPGYHRSCIEHLFLAISAHFPQVKNARSSTAVQCFGRVFSRTRTRTQHRGTRTRTRRVSLYQAGLLVRKFMRTASIDDRQYRSSNSHRVRLPFH